MIVALRAFALLVCTICVSVGAVRIQLEDLPEKCDFSRCAPLDASKLNVHLVPHTHDDVGWLKTVDQYYYGSANKYQKAGVQYVLDTVMEELIRDKDRRFIYVETAFFWKWWLEQNDQQRAIVHELVRSGQLEFINGGWSMNDEAATHYNSIIDQMTWGLRRLNDTFGRCGVPRVAWHIDPFGHSREQASLFAAMNFDALFFARQDYQDRLNRISTNTLEHMWQASDDLGTDSDLMTGMMKNHYGPLPGMHWDLAHNNDDPIIDNPLSEEYNLPKMVDDFVRNAKSLQEGYPTNNIMIPMGEDFNYMDAHIYYKNMDKLIAATRANHSLPVNVFYSTPSCYAKAIRDSGVKLQSKVDDFFPYASDSQSYWTGYFTSRPTIKRFERVGNNVLQACKQLDALAANGAKRFEPQVTQLREMMGVMQHHDAVTGTEKQHVTEDYAKNLHAAIVACQTVIEHSYHRLLTKAKQAPQRENESSMVKQHFCPLLNVSRCEYTERTDSFVVNLYNPLAHSIANRTIRFPVKSNTTYKVFDSSMNAIDSFLVPVPNGVSTIPERKAASASTHELEFRVDSLPPLGLQIYFINQTSGDTDIVAPGEKRSTLVTGSRISAATKLRGKGFDLHLDADGQVTQIELRHGGDESKRTNVSFKNEIHYYRGATEGRHSGAYIFRPREQKSFSLGKVVESHLFVRGTIQEVHQRFESDWITQVIRVDATTEAIEFDWVVGPIPVKDKIGKEIVSRYVTDLDNGQTFYTDANGRQMMKRTVNHRDTWKLNVVEPVSGNYYPINSRAYLRDEKRQLQLTILTDRSQGGSSLQRGTLELMTHRRLLVDDYFGVGEALNEPGTDGNGLVVRGRHLVLVSSIDRAASLHREMSQQLFMEPVISFADYSDLHSRDNFATRFSGIEAELPPNVHLLTLEQWRDENEWLIRLEHFYQKHEDARLSEPVTVSLGRMIRGYKIVAARELTLAANADISDTDKRLRFNFTRIGQSAPDVKRQPIDPVKLEVTLRPMQIRTFAVRVSSI